MPLQYIQERDRYVHLPVLFLHLDCCVQDCSLSFKKDALEVEKTQKRAIRVAKGVKYLFFLWRSLNKVAFPSLEN